MVSFKAVQQLIKRLKLAYITCRWCKDSCGTSVGHLLASHIGVESGAFVLAASGHGQEKFKMTHTSTENFEECTACITYLHIYQNT